MPASNDGLRAREAAKAALELVLRDQHGEARRLADYLGRSLVVYFYPRDDTPGCTVEGKEFNQLAADFERLNCAIVGVSVDSVESHRAFAEKYGFTFTLLADESGGLARSLGVMGDSVAERATLVFDAELKLRRAFRNVAPRGHAREVLGFVRKMLESHLMLGG